MEKEILLEMLEQNRIWCWATFNKITGQNATFRLNGRTSSAGFIYRHVGETINTLAYFLGVDTGVQNTTMGKQDEGQGKDIEASRLLVQKGFAMLKRYVEETPENAWLDPIDTPFFGTVSRARYFSHILFHNYYHLGQVALTLARGEETV